jgi:hypothetical protein
VVLLVAVGIGVLLTAYAPVRSPMPGHGPGRGFAFQTADDFTIIVSTVNIALLLSLLFVYAKVYSETKAIFSLGLLGVLIALLLHTLAASPLFYGAFGHTSGGLGGFLLMADLFKAGAFTLFLYLSLE